MKEKSIEFLREKIATIDDQLTNLLRARFYYALMIGREKKKNNIPIVNKNVMKSNMKKYVQSMGSHGEDIYKLIHEISVKLQNNDTDYL
jgi:hypothetical protein